MEKQNDNANFMDVALRGMGKGLQLVINTVIPNVLFSFFITQLLTLSGLIDVIGKLFTPVMFLFGLPGAAAVPLTLSMVSPVSAVATAVALIQGGSLTPMDAAIMLPSLLLAGSLLLYLGRVSGTTGIQQKHYKYVYAICFINAILSLWVTRFVLLIII